MEEDPLVEEIRRGGRAYLAQVFGLALAAALYLGAMFTGLTWLVPVSGLVIAATGVATLLARHTAVPSWTYELLLSWLVEDRLQRQRWMAIIVGVGLILVGLFWAGTTALLFFAP